MLPPSSVAVSSSAVRLLPFIEPPPGHVEAWVLIWVRAMGYGNNTKTRQWM